MTRPPRRRRRRWLRWTGRAILGVLGAIVLAVGAAVLWLRTGLPSYDGTLAVAGIEAPVEIVRDRNAVPHIRAASLADAYRALGVVHAQDRLWQMETMRRAGAGRLAEIAGPPALRADRIMRTLGLYALAEESLSHLSPEARGLIEAYTQGVNAYLAVHRGPWPIEFYLARIRPEPWRAADTLVWGRVMALRLTGNWRDEVLRARFAERLTPRQIADLWPRNGNEAPTTLSARPPGPGEAATLRALAGAFPDTLAPTSASNSWAIAGTQSATGKPLLANDPHLGFSAPGIWYLARLSVPGLDLAGATTPGVPIMILGHNGRIAWALTTTDSDTQDLYWEKTEGLADGHYLTPDGPRPFETRSETIKVRGEPDQVLAVRHTRHGPVISDLDPSLVPSGRVVALGWTGLRADDRTPEAMLGINRATDWSSFRDALRLYTAPQQNITYADTAGNIGFIAPGRVPIRRSGRGLEPAPGWTDTHGWSGMIPFDELPQAFNPPAGRIVNANHRIVPDHYPYWLGDGWAEPYRARRIHALLDSRESHDAAGFAVMQSDAITLAAAELVPRLTRTEGFEGRAAAAVARLRQWDFAATRDRAEPLIFTAWLRELGRALYADELGPLFRDYWDLRPGVLLHMLAERPEWCDDVTTPEREDCAGRVQIALDRALDDLAARFGDDMSRWRWGTAHTARFRHSVFGFIPVLRDLVDIRVETDGDAFTINRGGTPIARDRNPFEHVHGAGFRAVYDLADLGRSVFTVATGQSGSVFSRHYDDLTVGWRDGRTITIPLDAAAARKDAIGVLVLSPAGP
ncbi:MAG: penicillin acylase family protein [Alphaproteobacteria bacterium]|nr:penicillin acylase family protein [Alphaproteobacteria bacterium]